MKKQYLILILIYLSIIIIMGVLFGFTWENIKGFILFDTFLFIIILMGLSIIKPQTKELIQFTKNFHFKKLLLNKTNFAGINYTLIPFSILFLITVFCSVSLGMTTEKHASIFIILNHPIIFLPIALFTILILLFLFLINKITFIKLKKDLKDLTDKKILSYTFGELLINTNKTQPVKLKNNLCLVDIILAYTNNNLYIKPTFSYTKQKLIKINITSIISFEYSDFEIKKFNVGETTNSIIIANSGLPFNQIMNKLTTKMTKVTIKTATQNYEIVFKKRNINFFKAFQSLKQ